MGGICCCPCYKHPMPASWGQLEAPTRGGRAAGLCPQLHGQCLRCGFLRRQDLQPPNDLMPVMLPIKNAPDRTPSLALSMLSSPQECQLRVPLGLPIHPRFSFLDPKESREAEWMGVKKGVGAWLGGG